MTPLTIDWKNIHNRVVKSYINRPLTLRKLIAMGNGQLIPLEFDGKYTEEIPVLNNLDEPEYDYRPGIKDTNIDGDILTIKTPQIYETVYFDIDSLKQTFAGNQKLPIIMEQILDKIAQKEETVGYTNTDKDVDGLFTSSGGHDLGNPTAAWGIDTGSNGILNNVIADTKKALDYFAGNNLADRPIDVVVTHKIYNLFNTTIKIYGDVWAREYFLKMLNGGTMLVSDNIQAADVSETANTVGFMVRDPNGWALLSSNLDRRISQPNLWSVRYGLREKFAVKVLNDKYIAWMDGISVATS